MTETLESMLESTEATDSSGETLEVPLAELRPALEAVVAEQDPLVAQRGLSVCGDCRGLCDA